PYGGPGWTPEESSSWAVGLANGLGFGAGLAEGDVIGEGSVVGGGEGTVVCTAWKDTVCCGWVLPPATIWTPIAPISSAVPPSLGRVLSNRSPAQTARAPTTPRSRPIEPACPFITETLTPQKPHGRKPTPSSSRP